MFLGVLFLPGICTFVGLALPMYRLSPDSGSPGYGRVNLWTWLVCLGNTCLEREIVDLPCGDTSKRFQAIQAMGILAACGQLVSFLVLLSLIGFGPQLSKAKKLVGLSSFLTLVFQAIAWGLVLATFSADLCGFKLDASGWKLGTGFILWGLGWAVQFIGTGLYMAWNRSLGFH